MPTEKPGDTGKLAAERLRDMLPDDRGPRHPRNHMRGLGPQTPPAQHETTPKSDPDRRFSLPPDDELSLRATDELLRVTGVMGGLDTEVGAPVRDHAQQALADADTVELSDGHAARVRMAAQKPPEEVEVSFHFHSIGGGNGGRTGLILCIAAIVFAVVVFATGIALLVKAVTNSP